MRMWELICPLDILGFQRVDLKGQLMSLSGHGVSFVQVALFLNRKVFGLGGMDKYYMN